MGVRVSFAASMLTKSSSETGAPEEENGRLAEEEQASRQLLGNLQDAAEDGNGEEDAPGVDGSHGGSGVDGMEEDRALDGSLFDGDSKHGNIAGVIVRDWA